jgi:transposase-like protein
LSTATPELTSVGDGSHPGLRPAATTAPKEGLEVFLEHFPTEDACLDFIKEARWPNGITCCAKCGRDRRHHRVRGRKAYACNRCGNHIYPLRGTAFTKSSTPLQKWFYAVWLMATAKQPVTAKRIQREIRVTYKTAWRIRRELRVAMDAFERSRSAHTIDRTFVAAAGANASLEPSAARPLLLSQEVTCLDGIRFILNFFPAYLRMCRDV